MTYHSPSQAAADLAARRAAWLAKHVARAEEQRALRIAALEKVTTEPQPIRVPTFETREGLDRKGARYRRRRCKKLIADVEAHAGTGCSLAVQWLEKHRGTDGEDEEGIVALSNAEYLLARHTLGCP